MGHGDRLITLWEHQLSCIAKLRAAWREGKRRIVAVIPTGGGKTILGTELARGAWLKGGSVLWLAHRVELVEQAALAFARRGMAVGVIAASSVAPVNPTSPVQIATIQTLLAREIRPKATIIIWDEAHHASEAAEEWSSLLEAYPGLPVLGLTATPERGDGAGLAPLFDGLVVGATVRELTAQGFLVPCEVVRPARRLRPGELAQAPLDAYREHGQQERCLLFAASVQQAEAEAETFSAAGIRAACVHANTHPNTRRAILDAFRSGAVRVLCNVYVLTEGLDVPEAACCLLARGAGSQGIFLQMVGRVLRAAPRKERAILIDLRGVTHLHGFVEDERLYSLEGDGIKLAASERYCSVCGLLMGLPSGSPGACECPAREVESGQPVTITGDPLVKYAAKRAEGATARADTLRRWIRAALERGHSPKSVFHKWRHVYGIELDGRQWAAALVEVESDRKAAEVRS